jgi:membrane protein DedA with SNARE-associated domain
MNATVDAFLITIPPLVVYLTVGLVVGVESLGVPLPGEIVLVSAALLSSRAELDVSPLWIAVAATTGAVVGDSIGYAIGNRYGMGLFARLGRRFPRHFGPSHVAAAERLFARWGVLAVFFGRFVALLRIFAGPLAGALRMHYRRFLAANVLGGITWAAGTTFAVYLLGIVAERWLQRFSWIGLVVAVLAGLTISLVIRRRTARLVADSGGAVEGGPAEGAAVEGRGTGA